MGGCGKTRLALEGARRVGEAFSVWLIELAAISYPRRVFEHVAGVLAIRDSSDGGVAAALQDRTLLLALDNCGAFPGVPGAAPWDGTSRPAGAAVCRGVCRVPVARDPGVARPAGGTSGTNWGGLKPSLAIGEDQP
jgi:hypothetical protein